ncbi:MAG: RusA family crossover junction endodeoxyribonuclease [Candidatus Latescibacterota bacterium]
MTSTGNVRVVLRLFVPDRRRCDLDNCAKAVLDGLSGIAFVDDSQVADLHVTRSIDADNPRAEIEVSPLNGV